MFVPIICFKGRFGERVITSWIILIVQKVNSDLEPFATVFERKRTQAREVVGK
ncbi:hypothetical protein SAMN02745824_1931 [Parasphingorhabdus marina DSM 22363]|uniref:Uncharacterized protein n=1 Tax=Parasphingorhabdus marina DSM 22363 TaxID=1123272 RepID=A0A1N6EI17_9SPHN|nr:hypothetical protein SAMN02745824_1931 [Parasphingorhabdus marina DSM 22363]